MRQTKDFLQRGDFFQLWEWAVGGAVCCFCGWYLVRIYCGLVRQIVAKEIWDKLEVVRKIGIRGGELVLAFFLSFLIFMLQGMIFQEVGFFFVELICFLFRTEELKQESWRQLRKLRFSVGLFQLRRVLSQYVGCNCYRFGFLLFLQDKYNVVVVSFFFFGFGVKFFLWSIFLWSCIGMGILGNRVVFQFC